MQIIMYFYSTVIQAGHPLFFPLLFSYLFKPLLFYSESNQELQWKRKSAINLTTNYFKCGIWKHLQKAVLLQRFHNYSIHMNGVCKNSCTCCRNKPMQMEWIFCNKSAMYKHTLLMICEITLRQHIYRSNQMSKHVTPPITTLKKVYLLFILLNKVRST